MRRGEQLLGTFVQARDPAVTEFLGQLGFDLLCFDGEHSAMGVETVRDLLAAADLAPVPALVRVAENEPATIAAALDAGAAGVVVPRVESAAEAAAAVAASRYPPRGERGLGPSRATGYGLRLPEYRESANERLLLAVQVETRAGLAALDELLGVEGVDMVFVGPADLGSSLAIDPDGEELRTTVESILRRSAAAGRLTGVFAASAADAKRWRDLGTELILFGTDLGLLARGVRETLAELAPG